ncbi:hypothetical protein PaeBR_14765 [Paenibacillus sp. BR2-3]|uniref:hypothetical protein n=1 Tax=Paenibacillus sp. BR2-3 TaxID=3048494 RepID=UPI003977C2FD
MIYSQFAVMPALKKAVGNNKLHAISGLMMKSYSPLTWTSLVIVVITGFYTVYDKKDEFTTLQSGPGAVLLLKLILVTALIVIFLLQVFLYGPKIKQLIMPSTPKTNENQLEMAKLEQTTGILSWWHLGIGVAIVIFGVILSQLLE